MSTLEAKPRKVRILNPKLLSIAALVLVVLALLFLAAPLIRQATGFQSTGIFIPSGNAGSGQVTSTSAGGAGPSLLINTSGTGGSGGSSASGATGQGSGNQFFIGGGGGNQVQGGTNLPARRITIGTGSRVGVILYFVALLVSLAAAVGMLFTKNWGRVLAIVMGVLYGLLGLVSLLPLLLIRFVGSPNPATTVLGIVHVLLAVSVIVLASIPGKPGLHPAPTPVSASS